MKFKPAADMQNALPRPLPPLLVRQTIDARCRRRHHWGVSSLSLSRPLRRSPGESVAKLGGIEQDATESRGTSLGPQCGRGNSYCLSRSAEKFVVHIQPL